MGVPGHLKVLQYLLGKRKDSIFGIDVPDVNLEAVAKLDNRTIRKDLSPGCQWEPTEDRLLC